MCCSAGMGWKESDLLINHRQITGQPLMVLTLPCPVGEKRGRGGRGIADADARKFL